MRNPKGLFAGLAAISLSSCSQVPSLEGASGTSHTDILIGDIVNRVKCEISDAFDDKLSDPKFSWLANWTAKVDLTLQINDQAGVSPAGSYTHYYNNAFNFAAGSTSLTTHTIAAVVQTFSLGAGVNYSEQAQRAETLTFTVSLSEIRSWRLNQRLKFASADALFCGSEGRELRGNLGLKEWTDSVLYPVENNDLQAGIHPQPGAQATKPPSPGAPSKGAALAVVLRPIAEVKAEVNKRLTIAANKASADAAAAQAAVTTSQGNVQAAMQLSIQPYFTVLTDDFEANCFQGIFIR